MFTTRAQTTASELSGSEAGPLSFGFLALFLWFRVKLSRGRRERDVGLFALLPGALSICEVNEFSVLGRSTAFLFRDGAVGAAGAVRDVILVSISVWMLNIISSLSARFSSSSSSFTCHSIWAVVVVVEVLMDSAGGVAC